MDKVRFVRKPTSAGRVHYLDGEDVMVLLGRLPEVLWSRLRQVHFTDRARGNRVLGYVTRGRRDIAICALPEHVSLGRMCRNHGFSARTFGAPQRGQWPRQAVRRLLLYDIFLHELGHLQIVDEKANSTRRRFAGETKAEEFANRWRRRLWVEPFDHAAPVHNPPSAEELELLTAEAWSN